MRKSYEKPELEAISRLPEKSIAFYETRHLAKRGRNLHTDQPIEGNNSSAGTLKTSPNLHTQTWGVRVIRGEAATATVDHYTNVNSRYIAQLHQHVMAQLSPNFLAHGGQVHLVRPTRDHYAGDATLNFLTFCTQTEIARTLNNIEQQAAKQAKRPPIEFTDHKSCITISRTARTEASPIHAHDKVIIVDDHVQAGSSMLAMAAAVKEAQADILGLCALTTHPYCPDLSLHCDVKQHMLNVLKHWDPNNKVINELAAMGMPIETLTNAEALILIAYATNPHDEFAVRKFKEIDQTLQSNGHVMDGEHDSLTPILNQLPISADKVIENIQHCARTTRNTVEHTPVTHVEVLDWDSCITNEKAMNYQLMVNALFVAAHEYAQKYPEIQQLAKAIAPNIHGEGYQEGMPKLCMGPKRFSEFGITHPEFWKKHMPIDLLENSHVIAPQLKISSERQTIIISIL